MLNGAGEWIDAPPIPGAYVVNIGDLLELWTNGAFVATSHRVRKVTRGALLVPAVLQRRLPHVVEPLPQFASADGPARPPLVAGEHLFAQTAQTFTYLRARLAAGELVLPEGSLQTGTFGQQALQTPELTTPGRQMS